MNPVVGPTTKLVINIPRRYISKICYRQAKPYDLLLPFTCLDKATTRYGTGTYPKAVDYGGSTFSPLDMNATGDAFFSVMTSAENTAKQNALKRFNSGLGDRASLGVALAQRQEAFSMISKRALQIRDIYKAVKRFDLPGVCKALGITTGAAEKRHRSWVRLGKGGPFSASEDIWKKDFSLIKRRNRARAVSGLWLEMSFGWLPLIDDVRKAVGILNEKPTNVAKLKCNATQEGTFTRDSTVPGTTYDTIYKGVHKYRIRVSVGGTLTVTNSNYSLASRLGLTNLGLVIYEATPWSFVANYFVNIEEYLSQGTQYEGIQVSQAWWTSKWDDTISHTQNRYTHSTKKTLLITDYDQRTVHVKRTVGSLPTIRLDVRPSYHNGLKRALNNISLLIQLGVKSKR